MKTGFIALTLVSLSLASPAHARSGDYWPQTTGLNACYVEHIGQPPVTDPWADTGLIYCMQRHGFAFCADCRVNSDACRRDANGPDHPECYRAVAGTVSQSPTMPSGPPATSGPPAQPVAQDELVKRAMGELAGELEECSVFYLVVTACTEKQDPPLARVYKELALKVGNLAVSVGRAVGVSDEAYASVASLLSQSMMNSMGGSSINGAVLLKKYLNFCQRVSENADPRLKEWISCVSSQQRACPGGPE